jgi:predicted amidohydrolase YtcJ
MKYNQILFSLALCACFVNNDANAQTARSIEFINGRWFNGESFETKTMYAVGGLFSNQKPKKVDTTIDLETKYCVPPFGEAHNHNINDTNKRNDAAVAKYLRDGVFYVKEPGNFFVTDKEKTRLNLNTNTGLDVSLAQGASFTTVGGHPYQLAKDVWFRFGYAKGPIDSLESKRFFTFDNEEELNKKWQLALAQKPDFIKAILWVSEEYERRKNNNEYYGQTGVNPALLPVLVKKAHAAGLGISVHVNTAHDFHVRLHRV